MGVLPAFQQAQIACFDTNLKLYGQDCTWEKSGGDVVDTVLFNDPTKAAKFNVISGRGLSHVGYDNADVVSPYIEYRKGQFDGLFELVYNNAENQYVSTDGIRFCCKSITSFFDGQTYRIALQVAETETLIDEP
jgi:hypothetical protein